MLSLQECRIYMNVNRGKTKLETSSSCTCSFQLPWGIRCKIDTNNELGAFSAFTRCHIVREIRLEFKMIGNVQLLIGCSWHMYMKKQAFGQKSCCEKVETGFLMIESQARLPLAPSPSTNRPDLTYYNHISMFTHIAIIH